MSSATEKAPKKRGRRMLWVLIPSAFILLLFLVQALLYFFFVPKQPNFWPQARKPMNIAHQGGEDLAPSNTMMAFDLAVTYNVDAFETDIHMTKDGHLVLIHDNTVDRTTNGKGRVDNFTLAELKQLDAGYNFKDLQGNYSYRGKGATIATLDELLEKYGNRYYYVLEMKDAYPIGQTSQIEQKLWETLRKYHVEDRVVVASFHQELIDRFAKLSQGKVALSAGTNEAAYFVITHKFLLHGYYRPQTNFFQIPVKQSGFDLADKNLIDGAHRLNIQVHYWTIDDKETMKKLLDLGADGIITNRPDLMQQVLQERGK